MFEDKCDDLPTIAEEESLIPEIEERTKEEHDEHIGAEVLIDVGGEKKRAVVKSRARDSEGNPIGNILWVAKPASTRKAFNSKIVETNSLFLEF